MWGWWVTKSKIHGFSYTSSSSTCVWWAIRLNVLGFNYALSSNWRGSGELLDLIFIVSTTCWPQVHIGMVSCQVAMRWAQVHMDLMSCHTQHYWNQLHTEPKQTWVWEAARLNILGSSHVLSPNIHGLGELPDLIFFGSATC